MQAYADALLVIPKTLAINSGLDAQETIVKLQGEYTSVRQPVGLDISSGKCYLEILILSFYCETHTIVQLIFTCVGPV